MVYRPKSVGDGTASASAVQTAKTSIPSADGVVFSERLQTRPWLLDTLRVPDDPRGDAYASACEQGKAANARWAKHREAQHA